MYIAGVGGLAALTDVGRTYVDGVVATFVSVSRRPAPSSCRGVAIM